MNRARALLAVVAALGAGQAMACFTVYDRDNRVLYNAQQPPVDMSRPLHETMPAAYPGGHLVFELGNDCPAQDTPAGRLRVASPNGRSPLLTEAGTARNLGLPHTVVAQGVALVPQRPDDMRPGIVVAESGRPDPTTMMGAGPARPGTAMGAGPARAPGASQGFTVISPRTPAPQDRRGAPTSR